MAFKRQIASKLMKLAYSNYTKNMVLQNKISCKVDLQKSETDENRSSDKNRLNGTERYPAQKHDSETQTKTKDIYTKP